MYKKIFKFMLALFLFIFLVLEGFVGGAATHGKDIWKKLEQWIKK